MFAIHSQLFILWAAVDRWNSYRDYKWSVILSHKNPQHFINHERLHQMLFSIKATREQHRLPLSASASIQLPLTSPLGSPRWFILRAAGTDDCVREPITHLARQYQIQAGIISCKRGISLIFTCGFAVGPMACSHIWTGKTNRFISCCSTEFIQRKLLTALHITPVSKWQPGKVDVIARCKSWLTGNYPSIPSLLSTYTHLSCAESQREEEVCQSSQWVRGGVKLSVH